MINESSAQRGDENNQKIKNKKIINNNTGKIKPNKEMNHHLSGCKKALAHASKKRNATMMLDIIKIFFVKVRSVAMVWLVSYKSSLSAARFNISFSSSVKKR